MNEDKEDKIALIDLDGSICDYDREMKTELSKLRHPDEPKISDRYMDDESPYMEARRKLVQAKPGFWRALPRHPLGFQIIEEIREIGFIMHVLTKGPKSTPGAWSEKFEWCRHNIPDALVTVTQDKSLSYGRVLVDDYPPYFIPWLKHRPRGLVVCVAQPWNQDMAVIEKEIDRFGLTTNSVVRYDGTNFEEVRQRLDKAFHRKSREG